MALVGEAFLSASVQVLCDKIGSREFRDLFRGKKLDESLVKKLKITLLSLNAVLNDAEEKQFTNTYVKEWLGELQDAVFDADDLLDEINAEVLRCKVEAEYRTVKTQDVLGLREGVVGGKVSQRTPTTSLVDESCVYGRDGDKEKLMNLLLSDEASNKDVSVITVVGMGGVGKTTLAQLLYNDDKVKEHFNLRTWAYVSEDFDVTRVTKTLLESVSSKDYNNKDLSFLQVELGQQIKGKKFLFVLDDLWNENYGDLSVLQRPFASGASGSWVIVTTRNESVAARIRTVPIHFLKQLSDEDCWLLLSKHAFENGNSSARLDLEEVGKKIATKCNGLPLAAETLGGLLRFNTNYEEWNSILNSNIWELPPEKCNTIPALRLSYHYLPTHLKRCFAYCSIFPKGYEFQKEDIVLLWVAESLIPQAESENRMEELTKKYFDDLLSRSFFQRSRYVKSQFTMHDLINDLAMSVARESCLRWEGGESHEVFKRVRHLSYARGQFDCAAKFEPLYEVKNLRTFLPQGLHGYPCYVSKRVLPELLPNLTCLRVLTLSKYHNIVELPNSIGNLIHLRYLNLSNTRIKRLPSTVCTLYSLQTLLLASCRSLFELPADMRKLINLRHLDCSGTQIEEMPVQMGRLKSLRTLTTFVVGKSTGSTIGELGELSHLGGKLSILKLNNVVDGRDALQANLKNKQDLKELELAWGSKDADHSEKVKDVLDKLQPCMNLEKLTVTLYGGTSFSNWLGDSAFNKIKVMRLVGCHYCFELPPLGQLPALKELFICEMKFLRTLGPELYGQSFQSFQSLEKLEFEEMPEWEEWVSSVSGGPDFPRLQELILEKCPKLRGSLPCDLPCLKKLSVKGCGVLHDQRATATTSTSTSLNYNSLEKLEIEDGCQTGLLSLLETKLLSKLHIGRFNDIQCLPNINRLRSLSLSNCPTLSSFPEDGLPTSLTSLKILICRRLEFLPQTLVQLTSLRYLSLENSCDSMRSFPLGIFPKLRELYIVNCENLESLSFIEEEGVDENLSHLNGLTISGCPNLECFPQGGLPTPNLTYLEFSRCEKLKSLPDRIHTLIALRYLYIWDLPNLESIAEDGGLPSNLRYFTIENCERLRAPSSSVGDYCNWGLQALVSLEEFTIGGRGSDEILETLLKQQLLPTTLHALSIYSLSTLKSLDGKGLAHLTFLRSLSIARCDSLEFLPGEALQHLTSLQELYIYDCPSLQFLPEEGLPPSLSYLRIYNCSGLEKRYQNKTGEDHWDSISHIPCIRINDEVII
ncbi:unnamed protein product [Prunus armeniaca]